MHYSYIAAIIKLTFNFICFWMLAKFWVKIAIDSAKILSIIGIIACMIT